VRYRLRFLLQELDLPRGITIVGRSLDCHLTIEDPLVSREHARITIDDDGARVEDLGSRNGVRVNGLVIRRPCTLQDGDRVRIGTQDFVLCRIDSSGKTHTKTTGVLRLCAKCRLPFARETVACPHCKATEQMDEETLTTSSRDYRATWSAQLIVEALDRALALGRLDDGERIVRRAAVQIDELTESGEALDAQALDSVAAKVADLALAADDPTWSHWTLELYRRTMSVPSVDVADRLSKAAMRHPVALRGPLVGLLDHLHAAEAARSHDEVEALTRLERTYRLIDSRGLPEARNWIETSGLP
jgi:hypothetical protein